MDLDTFLTTVDVMVDDWYNATMATQVQRRWGGKVTMSDSEVLTVALVGQWRVGVPWQSERGVVRYMQAYGRSWFPQMLGRSAFNERVRKLWVVLIRLQHSLAQWLAPTGSAYESVDCAPLPACPRAVWRSPAVRQAIGGGGADMGMGARTVDATLATKWA